MTRYCKTPIRSKLIRHYEEELRFEFANRDANSDPLTALLRSGAQQLINQAVEAEFQELLSQYSDRRTDDGHSVVVRNGHLPEREL